MPKKPFAIYHEHPDWFRPLFAELERRDIPFVRLDPRAHVYDPAEKQSPYSLVFNRMSPSAYLRGGVQGMFFTLGYLAHLERVGLPVVDLYALTNPQHTPWRVAARVLSHDVSCKYCYRSACPQLHHACLRQVSPAQAVDAAMELLAAAARTSPSRLAS